MYLDSVDWASLPNTLGMSQHGDGGVVGTKPYCASGNYIHRMSNFCGDCRFNYKKSTGEDACPQTVFYWDFLARHEDRFAKNSRMKFQVANVRRKREKGELAAVRQKAGRDSGSVGRGQFVSPKRKRGKLTVRDGSTLQTIFNAEPPRLRVGLTSTPAPAAGFTATPCDGPEQRAADENRPGRHRRQPGDATRR